MSPDPDEGGARAETRKPCLVRFLGSGTLNSPESPGGGGVLLFREWDTTWVSQPEVVRTRLGGLGSELGQTHSQAPGGGTRVADPVIVRDRHALRRPILRGSERLSASPTVPAVSGVQRPPSSLRCRQGGGPGPGAELGWWVRRGSSLLSEQLGWCAARQLNPALLTAESRSRGVLLLRPRRAPCPSAPACVGFSPGTSQEVLQDGRSRCLGSSRGSP